MGGNDIAAGSTGSTRNTQQERRDRQQDRYGREQTAREQLSNYSDHTVTNSKN
jgi:hypothetical protein